ncbi:hypothetical protein MJO28_013392 [Puccinia striiformis f. sp. tritici]|uniref:Uncharacterized protein n=1 Tax=Puccinia striiformis f. sp. tritici TaxID=168172 RepID=A0ACC0E014_9BASI|nr:hypothetical protein MJO28_013392 [Puccinia striiformis f. sp. tritici]
MLFHSFFFILAIVLLIQTETAHASFLCDDDSTEITRAATLGYCLRLIRPEDHNDPRITIDLTGKQWFVTLAKHISADTRRFTCDGGLCAFKKKEKIFCCHPQHPLMTLTDIKGASTLTIINVCYPRDGESESESTGKGKGKSGKGGKGGKGGNGGQGHG